MVSRWQISFILVMPIQARKNEIQVAFFALNHLQDTGTEIVLTAKDRAGNQTKTGFPHYIETKQFKKDSIRISDSFILDKLPEFQKDLAGLKPGIAFG